MPEESYFEKRERLGKEEEARQQFDHDRYMMTPEQILEKLPTKELIASERDSLVYKIDELESLQKELKYYNHVLETLEKVTEVYQGKPISVNVYGDETSRECDVSLVTVAYPKRHARVYYNRHTAVWIGDRTYQAKDWHVNFSWHDEVYVYMNEKVCLDPLTFEEGVQMAKDYVVTGEFPKGVR